MPARNTLAQLLVLYTNPESHNAQRHSVTDERRDGRQDDANSRSYCVVVRSAKKLARAKVRCVNLCLLCLDLEDLQKDPPDSISLSFFPSLSSLNPLPSWSSPFILLPLLSNTTVAPSNECKLIHRNNFYKLAVIYVLLKKTQYLLVNIHFFAT